MEIQYQPMRKKEVEWWWFSVEPQNKEIKATSLGEPRIKLTLGAKEGRVSNVGNEHSSQVEPKQTGNDESLVHFEHGIRIRAIPSLADKVMRE
jgi:hypothetical protein